MAESLAAMDSEVEDHRLSWHDPAGQLFWKRGELFRGMRTGSAPLFREMVESGLVQSLSEQGLIPGTRDAGWHTEEFPLILQHDVVPVVTYPSEWSGSHLKAAALAVLDLELQLRRASLTLTDTNPWNVLFHGARPLYVDFSSIAPLASDGDWQARQIFCDFYLNPLRLFAAGQSRIARRLLYDPWVGVSDREAGGWATPAAPVKDKFKARTRAIGRALLPAAVRPAMKSGLKQILRSKGSAGSEKFGVTEQISALREMIEGMDVVGPRTYWGAYYDNNFPNFSEDEYWTDKHRSMSYVLEQIKPTSVLDIGANRGWYSQLAARLGARVIATDSDETAVNRLYVDTCSSNSPVWSAFMDARFPEPAQGPAYGFFEGADRRFASEMVFALAVVHHLALGWHLSFRHIAEMLASFSTKWVVVEWIAPADAAVQRLWGPSIPASYNLDDFMSQLGRHFEVVERLASDAGGLDIDPAIGAPDRFLLICKRRS